MFHSKMIYDTGSKIINGIDEIQSMMKLFFAKTPDVQWTVEEFKKISNNSVQFEFKANYTDNESNLPFERKGIEIIEFINENDDDDDDEEILISKIKVEILSITKKGKNK